MTLSDLHFTIHFLFFRSKQVVHLETRIQFDLGSNEIKSGDHAAVKGDAEAGGQECLLTSGETATCMDFIACQKYTGIGLSDKLGMLLHRNANFSYSKVVIISR